jgi:hypothetical protein
MAIVAQARAAAREGALKAHDHLARAKKLGLETSTIA